MSTNGWLTIEQRYSLDDRREMEDYEHHEHFYDSEEGQCYFCDKVNIDLSKEQEEEDESEVC